MLLKEDAGKEIRLRIFNVVDKAPYCDYFNSEEHLSMCSVGKQARRCIIRRNLFINFHTSTFMQTPIKSIVLSQQIDNYKKWIAWVQNKLAQYPEEEEKIEKSAANEQQPLFESEHELSKAP